MGPLLHIAVALFIAAGIALLGDYVATARLLACAGASLFAVVALVYAIGLVALMIHDYVKRDESETVSR
jgi:hypothetical protein